MVVLIILFLSILLWYIIGSNTFSKFSIIKNQSKYKNTKFGFELNYPSNLTPVSKGPNEIQDEVQFEKENVYSGTNFSSYDTISFQDSSAKEIFNIVIFPVTEEEISPYNYINGYLYLGSACDSRWLDDVSDNPQMIDSVATKILAVTANDVDDESGEKVNLKCFYFKNFSGNKIVLTVSAESSNFSKNLELVEREVIPSLILN